MTGKTEKKPGQAWQAFRTHPGAVIRQTAIQLLLRLAGIGALLAGLCGGLALICIPQDWSVFLGFPMDYVAVSHLFFLIFLVLNYRGFALEAPRKKQTRRS